MSINEKYTFNFAIYYDKVPMIEFLDNLTVKEKAKIFLYINKFIEMKNNKIPIPEHISKYLDDGIFELKVNFETKTSRSFYFYEQNKEIIFTNGFIKKTNKTPINEISKAIKIKKYLKGK
jgi:phage-related protein